MTAANEYLTPDAAAEYVHLSPESLRRAVQRGDLTCARLGRLVRYRKSWLDEWADRQAIVRVNAPSAAGRPSSRRN